MELTQTSKNIQDRIEVHVSDVTNLSLNNRVKERTLYRDYKRELDGAPKTKLSILYILDLAYSKNHTFFLKSTYIKYAI